MATRLGIMSFAHLHAFSYAGALNELDGVQFVGIWDDDPARGAEMAGEYGVTFFEDAKELLAEVEGVIVTSENVNHKRDVLAAAEAGVHVMCEKPISVSVADAREMIEGCEAAGVKFMIAFPCRYSPAFLTALEAVRSGEIGEIVAIKGTNRGRNPGGWFNDVSLAGGGAIIDHTVHVVDLMRVMLGEEVSQVYAEIDTRLDTSLDCDDCGVLTMNFEGGCVATLDASWSRPPHYPTWGDVTMAIMGTGGNLWLDLFVERVDHYRNADETYEWAAYGHDTDAGMIADFLECVSGDREPPITGYDGLKAMEVALGAYRAAETRRPTALPLAEN